MLSVKVCHVNEIMGRIIKIRNIHIEKYTRSNLNLTFLMEGLWADLLIFVDIFFPNLITD